jgi:hypothetical protein
MHGFQNIRRIFAVQGWDYLITWRVRGTLHRKMKITLLEPPIKLRETYPYGMEKLLGALVAPILV